MAQGAHKITEQFEQELCKYTTAPYCIAVDNCSNALFLALYYELWINKSIPFNKYNITKGIYQPVITIPRHTYPSVACEIIHAGGKIEWVDNLYHKDKIEGAYQLFPTKVIDSSLHFTNNMYNSGKHMCLSFTGPYKHLKLGKGGAIITDDLRFSMWAKRARFSGRNECSYFEDDFDCTKTLEYEYFEDKDPEPINRAAIAGWNFYMMPEIAARGILLLQQFYDRDGKPKSNEDLCMAYPDLSKFKIFNQ
jgi:dTDP-4-amino-4,6-dideoxygalactose transaminase